MAPGSTSDPAPTAMRGRPEQSRTVVPTTFGRIRADVVPPAFVRTPALVAGAPSCRCPPRYTNIQDLRDGPELYHVWVADQVDDAEADVQHRSSRPAAAH
ncbi:hypothetical protein AURDEDRAFT_114319 [Auricularia subglabra TFB-10046 SS5]|nr:hypothetical protein AURDEDRAFT_114319 [Auricularia subglabra TFB-10046 SS5]